MIGRGRLGLHQKIDRRRHEACHFIGQTILVYEQKLVSFQNTHLELGSDREIDIVDQSHAQLRNCVISGNKNNVGEVLEVVVESGQDHCLGE